MSHTVTRAMSTEAFEAAVRKMSYCERRLMSLNMRPHELIRMLQETLDESNVPEHSDPMRPLTRVRSAISLWVRSSLRTHQHLLRHEIDDVVERPQGPLREAPEVLSFVYDTVWLGARCLFWEAVRRTLLSSGQDIRTQGKVRCICECLNVAEETGRVSHPIMSEYVFELFAMSAERLRVVDPPYADYICQVPWLRLELYEVIESSSALIHREVRERHAQAVSAEFDLTPEEGAPGGEAREEAAQEARGDAREVPLAPSLRALESGDPASLSSAEGIVLNNYLARGYELEDERAEARDSYYEAALRQHAP